MPRLANKAAVVTGASSGIGRITAKLFAAEGAEVVVGARREAELASLVADIEAEGGNAAALAGDVRSENYAKALVALAVERFGRLDIAFNNAGTIGETGPSTGVSEAGWNEAITINLTASFLGAKHQIAEMLKHGGGSVIFTSTFVGYSFAFPGVAAYAASKSGLIGLTPGACRRIRSAGRARQRRPARRSRHRHVSGGERHSRKASLHHQPACVEASGQAGGSRAYRSCIWPPMTPPSSAARRYSSTAAPQSPGPEPQSCSRDPDFQGTMIMQPRMNPYQVAPEAMKAMGAWKTTSRLAGSRRR